MRLGTFFVLLLAGLLISAIGCDSLKPAKKSATVKKATDSAKPFVQPIVAEVGNKMMKVGEVSFSKSKVEVVNFNEKDMLAVRLTGMRMMNGNGVRNSIEMRVKKNSRVLWPNDLPNQNSISIVARYCKVEGNNKCRWEIHQKGYTVDAIAGKLTREFQTVVTASTTIGKGTATSSMVIGKPDAKSPAKSVKTRPK